LYQKNTYGKAQLLIKDTGILSGVTIAEKIFNQLDPNLKLTILLTDGTKINYGDIAFFVEGLSASFLLPNVWY